MTQLHRHVLGAALVVASCMLMIFGNFTHDRWLIGWAFLTGQAGTVVIFWLLLERCHEQITQELAVEETKVEQMLDAFSTEMSRPTLIRPN
jgi:hypothetical protein